MNITYGKFFNGILSYIVLPYKSPILFSPWGSITGVYIEVPPNRDSHQIGTYGQMQFPYQKNSCFYYWIEVILTEKTLKCAKPP